MKPAELATLQFLLAHPGASIAAVAQDLHRSPDKTRDDALALARMGCITLPPGRGLDRVPLVTAEGAQRASQPSRVLSFTSPITTELGVSETGMDVLRALLVHGAMSIAEIAKRLGGGWGKVAEISSEVRDLSASGFLVHDRLVALTEKGQRAATGDLHATAAVHIPRSEPGTRQSLAALKRDIDSLVPPSFRTLGGIKHPPIPRACERPKGTSLRAWLRYTEIYAPHHDAYVRGVL